MALAPLSSFQHFTGPLSLFLPFYRPIAVFTLLLIGFFWKTQFIWCVLKFFLRLIATRSILDVNQGLLRQALRNICEQTHVQARICRLLFMSVIGPNAQNIDLVCIICVYLNMFIKSGLSYIITSYALCTELLLEVSSDCWFQPFFRNFC